MATTVLPLTFFFSGAFVGVALGEAVVGDGFLFAAAKTAVVGFIVGFVVGFAVGFVVAVGGLGVEVGGEVGMGVGALVTDGGLVGAEVDSVVGTTVGGVLITILTALSFASVLDAGLPEAVYLLMRNLYEPLPSYSVEVGLPSLP